MYRNKQALNDSATNLRGGTRQSTGRVYPYEQVKELKEMRGAVLERKKLVDDYYQDYKGANYDKALKYFYENSYRELKISGDYRKLQMFGDPQQLKGFGIGIYLYIELFRRLAWIFLLLGILSGVPIALNVMGSGLSRYSLSYGTYLITATLGNYSNKMTDYDAYIITGVHCMYNLIFFIFFLFWKTHTSNQIEQFQTSHDLVHPKKYCVEISGFPLQGVTNQELQHFFSNFGPVYECSIVYDYRDKLKYFQQVDELDEQIKECELEIRLGGGDLDDLEGLKKQKHELVEQINNMKIAPHILSAYVHFEYVKGKEDLLKYYSDHFMFNRGLHECSRAMCSCCIPELGKRYVFREEYELKVLSEKVNDPEEINWESIDVSSCSRFMRITVAIIIIVVFIAVCSTLVSLCSIFISVNSTNCDGVPSITLTVAKTTSNSTEKTCFCNSNLLNFGDSSIQELCKEIFQKLYVENGLQIAAALISIITNAIFSFIIRKIVDFTKPRSFSSSLITKTIVLFLFLLLNTSILPLLIYADVYTFKIASYVSLVKLINPNINDFFNMDSFTYYSDFSTIWYRNVSPYFINFLILNMLVMWLGFAWKACSNSRRIENLKEEEGKILQKHMNKEIVKFEIDVVGETAELFLIVFICLMYSGGMPAMIALGSINILSRYIINKYLIVNYSKRVEGLTESFSELSIGVLPWAIIISCFFGIWMQTSSIYIYNSAMQVQIPGMSEYESLSTLFPRIFYISYTLVLGLLVIVYYFFYNLIVRFFTWLGSLCYEAKEAVGPPKKSFTDASRTMNVLHSYNIHSNPKYKNIILNLERYLQDEEQE